MFKVRGDTWEIIKTENWIQIVANKRNEIDVDKFDYILRDGLYLGIYSNFNYKRFFQLVRVNGHGSEQQLCVRDKVSLK